MNIHTSHVNNITRFETIVICAAFWAVAICACSPRITHQRGETVRTKYCTVVLIAPHYKPHKKQLFWYARNVQTGEVYEWLPDGDIKK